MFDLITIGSATLDIIVKSRQFTLTKHTDGEISLCQVYGGKMDVEEFKMTSGGGATNVAVGAARLGLKTAMVCEVGKDFPAEIIWNEAEKDGVETAFIVSERLEETAVSVLLVAADGGRSILTHRGAAYQLESRDIPWDRIDDTKWLHLGTLGGQKELLFDLFEFMSAHQMHTSWTPSPKDLDVFIQKQLPVEMISLDVLMLNKQEWEHAAALHSDLLAQIPYIFVTHGKKGGQVFFEHQAVTYQVDPVKAIEETGAGDAFATGVISGMLYEKPLPECIEWGKKNAASVVQYLGAKRGLLTSEEMREEVRH